MDEKKIETAFLPDDPSIHGRDYFTTSFTGSRNQIPTSAQP